MENYKNMDSLTKWVRYFLYIQVIVAIISVVSNSLEYQLLTDFQNGTYTSEEAAVADAEASDNRQSTVASVYLLVFIVSGVLILRWIYRANQNARALGAEGMTFTPGWSAGWYFVPVFTLWKPYQAMKEIWKASVNPTDWKNVEPGGVLGLWWATWIISNMISQAAFRSQISATELDELITSNMIYQVSDLVSIPLALVTLALINRIYSFQQEQRRTGTDNNQINQK